MGLHQLFVDRLPAPGERLALEGEERHYLGRALRARPGEELRLAAADGSAARALLESFAGELAWLRVTRPDPDPAEAQELRLELCPPRGEALDQALDAAVQMGAGSLRLLRSERTLANLEAAALSPERLRRRLRESARQCLRARLPALEPPAGLGQALAEAGPWRRLFMSERGGRALAPADASGPARVLVGPEGGFSASEVAAAEAAGWDAISLGPRPLKVPTAVAAALGGLRALSALRP